MKGFETLNGTAGGTFRTTWVCSGMFPQPISSALFGPNKTLISSMTAIGSGTNYYALHQLPPTPGRFVNEWRATINGYEYVRRSIINATEGTRS